MAEILNNIKWNLINKSNFEISKEQINKEILDIPYFPAQNYVNFDGNLDIYSDICIKYFTDGTTLFGLYEPEIESQRFILIEIRNNARKFNYRFTSQEFPQFRKYFSLTYDDNYLYLFGGYVNQRCSCDLWIYYYSTNKWENKTPIFPESENYPGRRRYGSLIKKDNYLYLFGGEVDVIIGQFERSENWITLNDLWRFDLDSSTWIQYDLGSFLPREIGKIVYVDEQYLHIAFADKIIVYDLINDNIHDTIGNLSNPIEKDIISFYKNNKWYILTSGKKLYEYNPYSYTFSLVQNNVLAIDDSGIGFIYHTESKNYGNVDYTRTKKVFCPKKIEISSGNEIEKYDINVFPAGYITNICHIGDKKLFIFSGIDYYNNRYVFYEGQNSTWIFDGKTNQTTLIDTTSQICPCERIYAGICYDKDRNCIWLFGGWNGTNYLNDLWKFDLNTYKWIKIDAQGEIPDKRRKVGICYVLGKVWIVGGENEAETFNDMYYYDIETNTWHREYPIDIIPFGTENV
ncbi:MAG TPA: hypothetical protein ENG63_11375, partial [Candidatus Desulfofervidus auxilii]|nr:hypothetical protein [Candidatus Desulfofervidus auxilii]